MNDILFFLLCVYTPVVSAGIYAAYRWGYSEGWKASKESKAAEKS